MKIMFATWLEEPNQGKVLTRKGGDNRLLSFFFIKDKPLNLLRRYILTGVIKEDVNESQ